MYRLLRYPYIRGLTVHLYLFSSYFNPNSFAQWLCCRQTNKVEFKSIWLLWTRPKLISHCCLWKKIYSTKSQLHFNLIRKLYVITLHKVLEILIIVAGKVELSVKNRIIQCVINLFKFMMTSSNGNIFCVTGPLRGEFTGPTQRPVTRSVDFFFDLRLNKRLGK